MGITDMGSTSNDDEIGFLVDSGASEHMVGGQYSSWFTNVKDLEKPYDVKMAKHGEHLTNKQSAEIVVKSLVNEKEMDLSLLDVGISDGLCENLFSVRKVEMKGGRVVFENGMAQIFLNETVIAVAKREGHVYRLKLKRSTLASANLAVSKSSEFELWHNRLGHLHCQGVKQLINGELVNGVPKKMSGEYCYVSHASRQR